MSRTFVFLFLICMLCLSAAAQVAPAPTTIVPGQPVERGLAGGESHTYQIALTAGQFMHVVVEQKDVDVALTLAGPDGKPLVESDLSGISGASESLSYEAGAAGTYQLVVRANGSATRSGAYQIRLDVKASAGVQDRKRVRAESLLNEARQLSTQGRYADPQLSEKLGQALASFRELEDKYLQGLTLNLMGRAHTENRQFDKGVEAYEQALSLWRDEKSRAARAGEASALYDLANAYSGLNRPEKAIECLEQALAIHRELKDRVGEGNTLQCFGLYLCAGEPLRETD